MPPKNKSLTMCFLQLERAMCVIHFVRTLGAGDLGQTSVCPAEITVEMAHVWAAVIFIEGQSLALPVCYTDLIKMIVL